MSNYLNVPSGGGAHTPDQAGLTIGASTIDVRCRVAPDVWDTGIEFRLVDSSDWGSANARWYMSIYNDGSFHRIFQAGYYNAAGVLQKTDCGSLTGTVADGSSIWLRVVMAPSAGTFDFYSSSDGSSWTQIGLQKTGFTSTGVNTAGTPPIVAIGQTSAFGGLPMVGRFYNTQVIVGASTILDMDWTTAALGTGTWVATTGETWTRFGASTVVADVLARNVAGWITRSGGY